MSDDILDQQASKLDSSTTASSAVNSTENSKETAATNPAGGTKSSSSRKSLFGNVNSDLQNALGTWEVLTEQMANKVSPDQEQLQDVKKLLGELKSKLAEFGE